MDGGELAVADHVRRLAAEPHVWPRIIVPLCDSRDFVEKRFSPMPNEQQTLPITQGVWIH